MDTKDLKAFAVVYEKQNISSAAKQLFITTQGLSKIIKKLEKELEVELFYRNTRGVIPTPYGDILYKNSLIIVEYLEGIKNEIKMEGYNNKKILKIASTLGVMEYLTVDFILEFKREYPDIETNILEGSDNLIDEKLEKEEAEVGFIAGPVDVTKYHAELFSSHKHCLVINKNHPLAKKDKISYKDLDNQPIVLESRDFRPYHNNMNRFLRANVKPIILMETTEIALTHRIASMNKGIGISVDCAAWSNPYPNTVIKQFEEEDCAWNTYFVYRKGKILSQEAEFFKKFAFKWLIEHKDTLFVWPKEIKR